MRKTPTNLMSGNFVDATNVGVSKELARDTLRSKNLEFYDEQLEEMREYFHDKGYLMAEAALDLLVKEKKGKWRKQDTVPCYAHEIDHFMAIRSFIETGMIDPKAEDEYGSFEHLFTGSLLHDVGEDFGYWHDDIVEILTNSIAEKAGGIIPEKYQLMVPRAARMMELLTHYRKFELDEIPDLLEGLDIPPFDGENPVLFEELTERVKGKFLNSRCDTENLQAHITVKNGKPLIIIGRHGKNENIGQDWNSYTNELKQDPYAIFLKYIDRIQGMSTRIAIPNEDTDTYGRYLMRTRWLFSRTPTTRHMKEDYPLMEKAFDSADKMMGVQDQIGGGYLEHLPSRAQPGKVLFAPCNIEDIDFEPFFPGALEGFRNTPWQNHPITTIMNLFSKQVQELEKLNHTNENGVSGSENLFRVTLSALVRDGGDEITELFSHTNLLGEDRLKHIKMTCTL